MLLAGAGFASLAACRTDPRPPAQPTLIDPAEPVPPLADRIAALERRNGAIIGLCAADLDTAVSAEYRPDAMFALCSMFKAYAAARVLQMSEAGDVRLTDRLPIGGGPFLAHSPRTQAHAGQAMTLSELCQAAVQVSDNTAANMLLTVIGGPPAITAFARSIGDTRTRLDRWELELNSAIPGDPRDTSTPAGFGGGIRALLTGDVLAPPQRAEFERWLRTNETSSIRPVLAPGWAVADKTGAGDYGSTNDIGVVFAPDGRRALMAIMVRSAADDPHAKNMQPLIGDIARLVMPEVLPPH